jgi:hypothetical protein
MREGSVESPTGTGLAMLQHFGFVCVLFFLLGTNVSAQPQSPLNTNASQFPVQAYGRHDKDCTAWTDGCVNCVRQKSGGDFSCSNIGIACQPKDIECKNRAAEPAK